MSRRILNATDRHVIGCSLALCWLDSEGTEWHPGSEHGIYVRFRGSEAIHFLHSGEHRWDGDPSTTGVVADVHDLLELMQAVEALKR